MLKPGKTSSKTLQLLLLLLIFSTSTQADTKPLIFGVHPYLHPAVIIERFQPLVLFSVELRGVEAAEDNHVVAEEFCLRGREPTGEVSGVFDALPIGFPIRRF